MPDSGATALLLSAALISLGAVALSVAACGSDDSSDAASGSTPAAAAAPKTLTTARSNFEMELAPHEVFSLVRY